MNKGIHKIIYQANLTICIKDILNKLNVIHKQKCNFSTSFTKYSPKLIFYPMYILILSETLINHDSEILTGKLFHRNFTISPHRKN